MSKNIVVSDLNSKIMTEDIDRNILSAGESYLRDLYFLCQIGGHMDAVRIIEDAVDAGAITSNLDFLISNETITAE